MAKGRTPTFQKAKAKAQALRDLNSVSYFLRRQLVADGLVDAVPVQTGNRGRPSYDYVVSGKGRGLLALSKNWK